MSSFTDYSRQFETIEMRRDEGILEMRFHTDGGPLQWNLLSHNEFERAFLAVGRDRENQVVIMTGTGPDFSGPRVAEQGHFLVGGGVSAEETDHIYWEGKHLLMNLLNIEVPVIAAVNGPAVRHAEIPLLSDIVIAAEEAEFQDSAHFNGGLVPGDGVHVVFPLLMGINRGRYFLLTGQTLTAQDALALGMVNEVLPCAEVLPRAWALARQLMRRSSLIRRYSRVLLTQDLKRRMHDLLGYGLALETLALRGGAA